MPWMRRRHPSAAPERRADGANGTQMVAFYHAGSRGRWRSHRHPEAAARPARPGTRLNRRHLALRVRPPGDSGRSNRACHGRGRGARGSRRHTGGRRRRLRPPRRRTTVTLVALDTSVAVPLLLRNHAAHSEVVRWWDRREVVLSGHAAVETYAVLTRLPGN